MTTITESDLFAMGMESETADKLMRELCERLGFTYPPEIHPDTAQRDAMADPLIELNMGIPATPKAGFQHKGN